MIEELIWVNKTLRDQQQFLLTFGLNVGITVTGGNATDIYLLDPDGDALDVSVDELLKTLDYREGWQDEFEFANVEKPESLAEKVLDFWFNLRPEGEEPTNA